MASIALTMLYGGAAEALLGQFRTLGCQRQIV
jgi:hypothetical protein